MRANVSFDSQLLSFYMALEGKLRAQFTLMQKAVKVNLQNATILSRSSWRKIAFRRISHEGVKGGMAAERPNANIAQTPQSFLDVITRQQKHNL